MKKISLLLLMFILCNVGFVKAQVLPEPSTGDDGPWYYIRVLGNTTDNSGRADRVLTGSERTGYEDELSIRSPFDQIAVAGTYANDSVSQDAVDKQLWRVEKNGDNYAIINKYWKKRIGLYLWEDTDRWYMEDDPNNPGTERQNGEKVKVMPVLVDDANTSWQLNRSPANRDYWQIIATDPISIPGSEDTWSYLHQGNQRWKYRNIMEIQRWGNEAESAYEFVSPDDMIMTVLPREIDFGVIREGVDAPSVSTTLTVSLYADINPSTITAKAEIEDEIFALPLSDTWTSKGGEVLVEYTPKQQGVTEDVILITANRGGKDIVLRVPVKGEYVKQVPVELSDENNEYWYYVVFSQRGSYGNFMTDKGVDNPITGDMYAAGNEAQMWKFVQADGDGPAGSYKMISKTGNQLVYLDNEDAEEGELNERFIAATTSDNTFGIEWRTNDDGDWQLLWNEGTPSGEGADIVYSYINKTNSDNQVTTYAEMPSEGSAIKFLPADPGNPLNMGLPQFSNDTETHWYYLNFARQSTKVLEEVAEMEYNTNIVQRAKEEGNTAQYFKLVGDRTEFIIESYSGKYFRVFVEDDNSRIRSVELTPDLSANYFTIVTPKNFVIGNWQIQNTSDDGVGESASYLYLNDFQGNAVCQYVNGDAGNDIVFTPAIPMGIEDIENGNGDDSNVNDPIVSTTYYTIQGLQLGSKLPKVEGLYIEKNVHASSKVSARKLYVPKQ